MTSLIKSINNLPMEDYFKKIKNIFLIIKMSSQAKEALRLFPDQVPHYNKIRNILDVNSYYIDNSATGSGKTFVTIKIALDLGLPVIVLTPSHTSSELVWLPVLTKNGVNVYDDVNDKPIVIPYTQLISKGHSQPKNGLLTKFEVTKIETKAGKEKVTTEVVFEPSQYLIDIIDTGCLVIFDEVHKAKNKGTMTNKAVTQIVKLVTDRFKMGGRSRVAFLSATMVSKMDHIATFLSTSGIVDEDRLSEYVRSESRYIYPGVYELVEEGERLNPDESENYIRIYGDIDNNQYKQKETIDYAALYFMDVLMPVVSSTMSLPDEFYENAEQNIHNLFLPLDDTNKVHIGSTYVSAENSQTGEAFLYERYGSDKILYDEALNELENVIASYERDRREKFALTIPLQKLQLAKVNSVVKEVDIMFQSKYYDENGVEVYPKVVIYSKFNNTIRELERRLYKYNPRVITGALKETQRIPIFREFQAPNNNIRLLIINTKITSESISLNDTTGRFPRIAFIMSDFELTNQIQIFGRFFRRGSVGGSSCYIVYGNSDHGREDRIIGSIGRSISVVKEFNKEQGRDLRLPEDEIILSDIEPIGPEGYTIVKGVPTINYLPPIVPTEFENEDEEEDVAEDSSTGSSTLSPTSPLRLVSSSPSTPKKGRGRPRKVKESPVSSGSSPNPILSQTSYTPPLTGELRHLNTPKQPAFVPQPTSISQNRPQPVPIYTPPLNTQQPVYTPPLNVQKPVYTPPLNVQKPVYTPPLNVGQPVYSPKITGLPPANVQQPVHSPKITDIPPVNMQQPVNVDQPVHSPKITGLPPANVGQPVYKPQVSNLPPVYSPKITGLPPVNVGQPVYKPQVSNLPPVNVQQPVYRPHVTGLPPVNVQQPAYSPKVTGLPPVNVQQPVYRPQVTGLPPVNVQQPVYSPKVIGLPPVNVQQPVYSPKVTGLPPVSVQQPVYSPKITGLPPTGAKQPGYNPPVYTPPLNMQRTANIPQVGGRPPVLGQQSSSSPHSQYTPQYVNTPQTHGQVSSIFRPSYGPTRQGGLPAVNSPQQNINDRFNALSINQNK